MKTRTLGLLLLGGFLFFACGKAQEGQNNSQTPTNEDGVVTGVRIEPESITLSKGQEKKLKAIVEPENAENKQVIWRSSDTGIATVKDGLVTAVGDGKCTITVYTVDGQKTATCAVEVSTIYVKTITLPENAIGLIIGGTYQIEPDISPFDAANAAIGYRVDKESVASVDKDGKVTALAVGTAKVTVYALDGAGAKATLDVTVQEREVPVEGVSVSPSEDQVLKLGETLSLKAVFRPADATNRKVSWSSDKTDVASVSEKGVVTGKARGIANITVKTEDGGFEASVKVQVVQAFSSISIVSPSTGDACYDAETGEYRFCAGDTFTLGLATEPAEADDSFEFYVPSTSTEYLAVDASGKVTVKKSYDVPRTVGVRSRANPEVKAELSVKLYDRPDRIVLSSIRSQGVYRGYPTTEYDRKSEYIGVGCTQQWMITLSSSTGGRLLPGKVKVKQVSSVMLDYKIEDLDYYSYTKTYLTVSVPATQAASTTTSEKKSVVRLEMPGGKVQDFYFKVSLYDPYQPKPGDGIWSTSNHILFENSVVDSGYRGNGIYEDPLHNGANSKVYALIAWLGDAPIEDDAQYRKVAKGLEPRSGGYHGIAVPVNADRLYQTTKTSGELYSGEEDDFLSSSSDVPKWLSNKNVLTTSSSAHTAYTNTAALIYRNAPCGASHEVYPANYFSNTPELIKISQDAGESNKDFSAGKFYFFGSFKNGGTGCTFNAKQVDNGDDSHTVFTSPWLFPTVADFYSIFLGTVPSPLVGTVSKAADKAVVKEKMAVLAHSAKIFSGTTLTYSGWNWWTSQQVNKTNAPQVSLSSDGTMSVKSVSKVSAAGYVLPICYF